MCRKSGRFLDITPVVVHDELSFRDVLRAEVDEDGPVDRELTRRV